MCKPSSDMRHFSRAEYYEATTIEKLHFYFVFFCLFNFFFYRSFVSTEMRFSSVSSELAFGESALSKKDMRLTSRFTSVRLLETWNFISLNQANRTTIDVVGKQDNMNSLPFQSHQNQTPNFTTVAATYVATMCWAPPRHYYDDLKFRPLTQNWNTSKHSKLK